jgi:hypothetical protein
MALSQRALSTFLSVSVGVVRHEADAHCVASPNAPPLFLLRASSSNRRLNCETRSALKGEEVGKLTIKQFPSRQLAGKLVFPQTF